MPPHPHRNEAGVRNRQTAFQPKGVCHVTEIILGILGLAGTIAASLVTYFLTNKKNDAEVDNLKAEAERHRLETEKIRRELYPNGPSDRASLPQKPCEISLSEVERSRMTEYYITQADKGSTIEIISLSLEVVLNNYGDDRFIRWIREGKHIRILVLSPLSMGARLRSREESGNEAFLPEKIVVQIGNLQNLYNHAVGALEHTSYRGSLEVRLYEGIPYFAYFRTENAMAIGLYYSHIKGLQSEVILVDVDSTVYNNMSGHFEKLWNKGDRKEREETTVCVISEPHMHFVDLNELRKKLPR